MLLDMSWHSVLDVVHVRAFLTLDLVSLKDIGWQNLKQLSVYFMPNSLFLPGLRKI